MYPIIFTRETNNSITATRDDGQTIAVLYLKTRNEVPTGRWRVRSISSTFAESEHLRKIADKIDELNGELNGIGQ